MSGFEALPHDTYRRAIPLQVAHHEWPEIVSLMRAGFEWPGFLAGIDVRWWAEEVVERREVSRFPSTRLLASRWGWTVERVCSFLNGGDWRMDDRDARTIADLRALGLGRKAPSPRRCPTSPRPVTEPRRLREAVSARDRFTVLTRCGFRCHYCGEAGGRNGAGLHIDHVVAVANGGTNAIENLVAACRDCNLGKSARVLGAE